MAEFVTFTQDNSTQEYAVNLAKVVKFWRSDSISYTVIELDAGASITVKEKPKEIWDNIHRLNRSA